jgi:hypothetical protein
MGERIAGIDRSTPRILVERSGVVITAWRGLKITSEKAAILSRAVTSSSAAPSR